MRREFLATVAVVALVTPAAAQPLSARIDARVTAGLAGAEPAPPASDEEFLRRIHLDLIGRIPTVTEARTFLDSPAQDKRAKLVDALLASPEYAANAARLWRTVLVPQATTNLQTQYLGVSVEAWVREKLRGGASDAQVVRDLLTARLDYLDWTPQMRANPAPGLSPVGFYQANDLKPETVSAAVSRTFLGLKLECAQCHDHPFDKWTQKQAWETAAFFAGVSPLEPEIKPAPGLALRRSLKVGDTKETATAKFLDGKEPTDGDPRVAFADWLTRKENPYFARVMANRVWANMFGVGLVDPADDWGPHNPPSHPELLDELAEAYAAVQPLPPSGGSGVAPRRQTEGGFDPKVLIRAIAASGAYQRTSRLTHPSQTDLRKFARMTVKGLSAEQLFDSLATATGYRDSPPSTDSAFGWPARSPRGLFIAKFGGGPARTDMQVSILQALSLMNGEWVSAQTNPATGHAVKAVAAAPFLDDAGRVEALFLGALGRRPSKVEAERATAYLRDAADKPQAVADTLWALVNSHEFLVNR
jgi:hypothetical protein